MEFHQLVIIGAGSAGMACALGAFENGIKDILIIERDSEYGGILQQCIHNGFGLHTFNEELSGPAYAEKYYELIKDNQDIAIMYDSTVIKIDDNKILSIQSKNGLIQIKATAIVLASGCRERAAGTIGIKGDRLKGIYTAGSAQKYCNKQGILVGKNVFVLGSGDIGLIMARRMTLEGAHVIGVAEIMPHPNGLARNIKQCLQDFDIPLYLSHTVESVHGNGKLESITLIEVDNNLKKIKNSEKNINCDLLLLSVGLIPENNLIEELGANMDKRTKGAIVDNTYMTSIDGIFACGNALHVHDLVDYVSQEGKKCGKACANYILGKKNVSNIIFNKISDDIAYMIPQSFYISDDIDFMFRTRKIFNECSIHIYGNGFDKIIKKVGVAPSEMQKISLKKDELSKLNGELFWEIVEWN